MKDELVEPIGCMSLNYSLPTVRLSTASLPLLPTPGLPTPNPNPRYSSSAKGVTYGKEKFPPIGSSACSGSYTF
jgi:hypothetical protein